MDNIKGACWRGGVLSEYTTCILNIWINTCIMISLAEQAVLVDTMLCVYGQQGRFLSQPQWLHIFYGADRIAGMAGGGGGKYIGGLKGCGSPSRSEAFERLRLQKDSGERSEKVEGGGGCWGLVIDCLLKEHGGRLVYYTDILQHMGIYFHI